jgi:energy-coupling factor transporter ATP-binding protein EcfA2
LKLTAVTIQFFKNIVKSQRILIEDDVTGLIGKNESGKTTALKALHRLNPANGTDLKFDLTKEYPRWRLVPDRRNRNLGALNPVAAEFELDDTDIAALTPHLPAPPPLGTICWAARSYNNALTIRLKCAPSAIIDAVAAEASVVADDIADLKQHTTLSECIARAKEKAKELKEGEPLRSKALTSFAGSAAKMDYLVTVGPQDEAVTSALAARLPKFFYFSTYDVLPGECDLYELAEKDPANMTPSERTVMALLAHAGNAPEDFLDEDYDSRKAELQATSADLSRRVFEYWRQNEDLEVVFDADNVVVGANPNGGEVTHRILKIELRDARHGGVETNFTTRSSGFQWFFSFFAAFSEYQSTTKPIIVLLDEPGTSLHGEAQKDFVRFIYKELGSSKQTIYTTHSQHMIDPARYEKLRAVYDGSTRTDPDIGVAITPVNLAADRSTLLPVESALGYNLSQHLFIGAGQHLAVEGSSDFVYLQRLTEYFASKGKPGLDPRLAIIPVGGVANMPAFVALLGRRLSVSALLDGPASGKDYDRVRNAAKNNGVDVASIITCAQVADGIPSRADIEDLFEPEDYLKLYNWAFSADVKVTDLPATSETILRRLSTVVGEFDHALPAHALTSHRQEFFDGMSAKSASRFEKLFDLLNATVIEET